MTYHEIMRRLEDLPGQIMMAEGELEDAKLRVKKRRDALEVRETILLAKPGVNWGTNDSQRKLNQKAALQTDSVYQDIVRDIYALENDVARIAPLVDQYKNEFYATRTQATLLAAWLLAGNSPDEAIVSKAMSDRIAPDATSVGL